MRSLGFIAVLAVLIFGAATLFGKAVESMPNGDDLMSEKPEGYPTAVLAGGCFWCVESEYRALDGVLFTRAGYMGGELENPSYQDITTGETGHAEVVEVTYDPEKITYAELLEFFFTRAHNPTELNRQGVDVGTQYRSAIFYADDAQKKTAEDVIAKLEAEKRFKKPIVTTLEPLSTFWEAEGYHQQYYEKYQQKTGTKHIRMILKDQKKAQ